MIRWYSTGAIIYNDNSVAIDEAMRINGSVPGDDDSIITTTNCHHVDNAGAICRRGGEELLREKCMCVCV